jgi:hypothetical protein
MKHILLLSIALAGFALGQGGGVNGKGQGITDAAAFRTNLGLGSVDNTSDANKPISTLQAAAIAAAEADANAFSIQRANHTGTQAIATVSGLQAALDAKLNLSGGTMTGNILLGGNNISANSGGANTSTFDSNGFRIQSAGSTTQLTLGGLYYQNPALSTFNLNFPSLSGPGRTVAFQDADGTLALTSDVAAAEATAEAALDIESTSRIISDDKMSRTDQILKAQTAAISTRQGLLPTKLKVLSLGDSFGGMSEMVNALGGKYHYIGRGLASLEAVYAGGASSLTDLTLWPAPMHTLPSGGSITFGVSAFGSLNYPIFTDRVRAFHIAENGAGTFKLQVEYNLSGTWIDATGTINADNSGTAVGTVASTSLPGPTGLVRMRIVGLSGTIKIIGGDISLNTANAAYPHVNIYDLSASGTLISNQLNASSAVVTPILTAIAPDLVTWCADDGASEITTNLPTLITQINTRSASTPDWFIVSSHPTGTGSQAGVQAAVEAARAVADASGYTFINMFNYFGGDTADMIAKGLLNGDNYHLSFIGDRIRGAEIVRVTGLANNFPRGFDAYLPEGVVGVSTSFHNVGAIWRIWSDVQTDRILDLSPINGYGFDGTRLDAYKNTDANFPSGLVFRAGSAPVMAMKSNGQTIIHKGTDFARATRVPTARLEISGTSSETQLKVDSAAGLTEPLMDLRVNGSQKVKVDPDGTITAAGKVLINEQDSWINASRLWSVKNALSFSGSGAGSYGDSNIHGWVNLGSGNADGGYRKVLIQRGINACPVILGDGVKFQRPIGVSFNYLGGISSATDLGRVRFIVGANNSAPAASGSDAISARGFGIELRRNGSNTEWRVFAHNGTTYTASSWSTLLSGSLITTAPSTIAVYSDGVGNITGYFGSGGAKATTTITTSGGPTATGDAADTYIAFEAINGTTPAGQIDTQLFDCQLYTPN